jgi:hypothetical protein
MINHLVHDMAKTSVTNHWQQLRTAPRYLGAVLFLVLVGYELEAPCLANAIQVHPAFIGTDFF